MISCQSEGGMMVSLKQDGNNNDMAPKTMAAETLIDELTHIQVHELMHTVAAPHNFIASTALFKQYRSPLHLRVRVMMVRLPL
jgi:hypothetical protein